MKRAGKISKTVANADQIREFPCLVAIPGEEKKTKYVLVISGKQNASISRFSIKENKWESDEAMIPSLNMDRSGASACMQGENFVYVIGGCSITNGRQNSIERLNLEYPRRGWVRTSFMSDDFTPRERPLF